MAVIYTEFEISTDEDEALGQATVAFVDAIEAMHREALDFLLLGRTDAGDDETAGEKAR